MERRVIDISVNLESDIALIRKNKIAMERYVVSTISRQKYRPTCCIFDDAFASVPYRSPFTVHTVHGSKWHVIDSGDNYTRQ